VQLQLALYDEPAAAAAEQQQQELEGRAVRLRLWTLAPQPAASRTASEHAPAREAACGPSSRKPPRAAAQQPPGSIRAPSAGPTSSAAASAASASISRSAAAKQRTARGPGFATSTAHMGPQDRRQAQRERLQQQLAQRKEAQQLLLQQQAEQEGDSWGEEEEEEEGVIAVFRALPLGGGDSHFQTLQELQQWLASGNTVRLLPMDGQLAEAGADAQEERGLGLFGDAAAAINRAATNAVLRQLGGAPGGCCASVLPVLSGVFGPGSSGGAVGQAQGGGAEVVLCWRQVAGAVALGAAVPWHLRQTR
jgi:hypothetical protein